MSFFPSRERHLFLFKGENKISTREVDHVYGRKKEVSLELEHTRGRGTTFSRDK